MLVWYPTDTARKSELIIIITVIVVVFIVVDVVLFLFLFLKGHVENGVNFQPIRNLEYLSLADLVRYILAFLFQNR